MGSLMAGWSSPVLDPEAASLERNKSMTKEEIEEFWRSQQHDDRGSKGKEEAYSLQSDAQKSSRPCSAMVKAHRPKSPTGDWWVRSNWAFLNEPPTEKVGRGHKYEAQFHVAEMATK